MYALIVITGGGFAYAQKPPQNTQPAAPAAEKAMPQPEIPKQISTVTVKNNRLSVEFVDVSFGEILLSISKNAGFKVEGSSRVFSTKVTTKFNDVGIDRGLIRLFSLVNESNYLISYNSKGSISKLKVYDILTSPPPSTTTKTPVPYRRRYRRRPISQ